MSQQRMRKASVAVSGEGSCARGFIPKASGDSVPCNIRPKPQGQRNGSKNKIPKNIRYDLENALVGLCDVWFEDIKPHLVRNNIKVHVHGGEEGGDHRREPRAAPVCSHLHPGAATDHRQRQAANYADSCSTLPTASRAPCRRPPALSPLRPPPPPPSPPSPLETFAPVVDKRINHPRNFECRSKPLSRRKSRSPKSPAPLSNWRVPRLCRTNTIISPSATPRTHMRRIQTAMLPQSTNRDDSFFRFIQPRRTVKIKHKSTQTELPARPAQSAQRPAPAPAPFGRCPATTTFFPPKCKISDMTECPLRVAVRPLFKQDLIDIIGEKNDKRIKLLYKCQKKAEYPSVMNLILSDDDPPKEPSGYKKKPWR